MMLFLTTILNKYVKILFGLLKSRMEFADFVECAGQQQTVGQGSNGRRRAVPACPVAGLERLQQSDRRSGEFIILK